MMRKRFLPIAVSVLVLATGLLVVNAYQEVRFDLPAGFVGLTGFADSNLLAYVEFPASSTGLEAFRATVRGKRFFADELMREIVVDPAEELVHSFARRLSRHSGIPLGADELAGLLRAPFALAVFSGGDAGKDRLLGMLSIGAGDRLLVSVFAKLAAAVSSEGELVRTTFKGLPLYTLASQGDRRLSFTLANNVLLVSPEADLIKQALANASLADTKRPADWDSFVKGTGENTFCRIWLDGAWLGKRLPLAAALYPPLAKVRSVQVAATLVPDVRADGRMFFAGESAPAALSSRALRDQPGDALLVLASPEFRLGGFTGIPGLEALGLLPDPHGKLLAAFAGAVPGEWSLAFSASNGPVPAISRGSFCSGMSRPGPGMRSAVVSPSWSARSPGCGAAPSPIGKPLMKKCSG
jgi:hypothetical protein